MNNVYMPIKSKILEIIQHTDKEFTFKMEFHAKVKPGQFVEVSIPKYGEAPISISGIGEGFIDLTIRKVGVVTDVIHTFFVGDSLFLRGPYGNGFDVTLFEGKEIIVAAGGSAIAPVRGIVEHFTKNKDKAKDFNLLVGFRSPSDILFKDDLNQWAEMVNVTVTVDSAPEDYTGNVGLVTKYVPELKIQDIEDAVVVVVGPPMMMKFTVAEFLKLGIKEENIWVSYERKMCCGVGKCGHCKMDDTYICLDGPVFNYVEAKTLVD